MSGKWDPPAAGWLVIITSSYFQESPKYFIWYLTASVMEPKWTGRCGALATRLPSGANKAQEKSNLSFIFVEQEVDCKVLPIYSAIDMNLFPKIDNSMGSQIISCFCY